MKTAFCLLLVQSAAAFVVTPRTSRRLSPLASTRGNARELGLLTFDLDDTLYPIALVEKEANEAFVKSMEQFGFEGLEPEDIVRSAVEIREEISEVDPQKAACLTHTEVRQLAIRREMERATTKKKLKACADDWATPVESLSTLVVANAKKWSKAAVSESMVKAVNTAWEMERHHSAERHLYPEVLDALKQIKEDHSTAIIGAVTDGRSNPLFMTFTLAPFFDFGCSWEDDQGGREKFFKELETTAGETSELTWIYDEARYKYAVLKQAAKGMKEGEEIQSLQYPDTYDDRCWIHVGDDLAFDVGASSACGARTVYAELAEKYGQTARLRYNEDIPQPSWSTTPSNELKMRDDMAKAAESKVDVTLNFLTRLPEAIDDILSAAAVVEA